MLHEFIPEKKLESLMLSGEVGRAQHPDKLTELLSLNRPFPSCLYAAQLRGLVTRGGRMLARPMRKFYAVNTTGYPETKFKFLSQQGFTATRFIDGFSSVLYQTINRLPMIAGSQWFTQQPMMWASAWYRQNRRDAEWPEQYTPNFCVVHPNHPKRIIYPEPQIYLISLVHDTGSELPWNEVVEWGERNKLPTPEVVRGGLYDFSYQSLADRGVVLRYDTADQVPFRVAVLSEEFYKTQKIVEEITPADICDMLQKGIDLAPLKSADLPEAFVKWVIAWEMRLQATRTGLEDRCCEIFAKVDGDLSFPLPEDEKLEVMKKFEDVCGTDRWALPIIKTLLDDNDPDEMLWQVTKSVTQLERGWQKN